MQIIDVPFGKGGELTVDEEAGMFSLEIKATILGTPEDVKLNLSVVTVLTILLAGTNNPIAKLALNILLNLFAV
jgi:hypothetical protein